MVTTQVFEVDLDSDGAVETVQFMPRGEPFLSVYRAGRRLWQWGKARDRAWKLQLVDIDEDGYAEFVVGVNRSTRWYPDRQNTIHILGWTGQYGYAKWLGSRLGSPLIDFALTRLHPRQPIRLATLERNRQNQPFVRVYRWSGFGFTALWQSEPVEEPAQFELQRDGVYLISRQRTYALRQPHAKLHFVLEEEPRHARTIETHRPEQGR
ncbi:MAG: hypothetical protein N2651_01915 [Fimbriimonadales bacterium]|nr:hypothetical protein [Fimbriimonadales bacterium]